MEKALYFLDKAFWYSPVLILTFVGTLFLIVLGRYLALAILYKSTLRWFFPERKKNSPERSAQYWREIRWSALSSLIFSLLSAACFYAYQNNLTKIYVSLNDYSIGYFFFSITIILFLYETYYYWLHRWMHKPAIYRIVHKVHHDSTDTSVFTSFSFHPLEALLQFIFIPVIIVIMPVHYYALGIVLMLMTLSAIVNHAGVEIFPKGFDRHPVGKWLIGSTHHDLHHREYRNNFGLYLTFWDKWMNTESKNLHNAFARNKTEQEK